MISCNNCVLHNRQSKVIKRNGDRKGKILLLTDYPTLVDETIGTIHGGEDGKLFEMLLNDAFKIKDIVPLSYLIMGVVECRPTDTLRGETREPLPKEILACTKRITMYINWLKPRVIFLGGKLAERFYKKELPDSYTLQPMGFLVKQGGNNSPYYKTNLRMILEGLK